MKGLKEKDEHIESFSVPLLDGDNLEPTPTPDACAASDSCLQGTNPNAIQGPITYSFDEATLGPPGVRPIQTAWTSAGTDDAWLVLDRNGTGSIDDASELFSCAAPQPQPLPGQIGNGFIALAEFDKPENGGNGDDRIDRHDSVFARLQLWTDRNKNGVSERRELERLAISEVRVIELNYEESKLIDQYGNKFKYRARVRDRNGAQVGRWAYDVFPVVQY